MFSFIYIETKLHFTIHILSDMKKYIFSFKRKHENISFIEIILSFLSNKTKNYYIDYMKNVHNI